MTIKYDRLVFSGCLVILVDEGGVVVLICLGSFLPETKARVFGDAVGVRHHLVKINIQ